MITAKNYVAQCEKDLNESMKFFPFKKDNEKTKEVFLNRLKDAVHFAIPDGGVILDDDYKGIVGQHVRLPFPLITTEYYINGGEPEPDKARSTKRVCLAQEVTTEYLKKHFPNPFLSKFEDDYIWIMVLAAAYFDENKFWGLDPCGFVFPSQWDSDFDFQNTVEMNLAKNGTRINGYPIYILEELFEMVLKTEGESSAMGLIRDASSETASILALCEALSCTNVMHKPMETIDPRVNERRIRDGKVPLYETRVLWINVPGNEGSQGDGQGGSHKSPKQHLRRGHIRRLSSGKNVWVNSTIVGAKENGYVEKQYAIRKAA